MVINFILYIKFLNFIIVNSRYLSTDKYFKYSQQFLGITIPKSMIFYDKEIVIYFKSKKIDIVNKNRRFVYYHFILIILFISSIIIINIY